MKKLITLVIVCTLINGCGLFKNTSKDVLISKSGVSIEQSSDQELKVKDNSQSVDINTNLKTSDKVKNTTIQADKLNLRPDGSFEAEGNVKYQLAESEKLRQLDSAFKSLQSDMEYFLKASQAIKEKVTTYDKEVHKESKPSGKGIIYGTLALLVFVIIVAWWFFGIGKAKSKSNKPL